jgi:hypothetical protein
MDSQLGTQGATTLFVLLARWRISSLESIPGLLKHLQIWAPARQSIGWWNQFLGIDSWAP